MQEIETGVDAIFDGLLDHALAHPSIIVSVTRRKGKKEYADPFPVRQGRELRAVRPVGLSHLAGPEHHLPKRPTTADIQAALQSVANNWQPFAINNFANGSLVVTKNQYFTYDFETSPPTDSRADQQAQTQTWPTTSPRAFRRDQEIR